MRYVCLLFFALVISSVTLHEAAGVRSTAPAGKRIPNSAGWFLCKPSEGLSPYRTDLSITWDAKSIHLTVRCESSDITKIAPKFTKRDDEVYRDESVEFFLQPDRNRPDYYHIVANTAGVILDARNQTAPALWNHPGIRASCKMTPGQNEYILAVTIPFAGWISPPKPGDVWGFNAIHTTQVSDEKDAIASLSRLGESAHEPQRFSRLKFISGGTVLDRQGGSAGGMAVIPNNSFEAGKTDWREMVWAGGNTYGNGRYWVDFSDDAVDGLKSLKILGRNVQADKSKEASRIGVSSNPITLSRGQYILTGYYKTDIQDSRMNDRPHLVDVYLGVAGEYGLSISPGWTKFKIPFECKTGEPIRIMLRLWADGSVWFDALDLVQVVQNPAEMSRAVGNAKLNMGGREFTIVNQPAEKCRVVPTAEQKVAGFIPYLRTEFAENIHPRSTPRDGEILSRIDLSVARDEYESTKIMIYALDNVKDFTLRFQASAADGIPLPAEWVELASVPFRLLRTGYESKEVRMATRLIFPFKGHERFDLASENTYVFYITIKSPGNARAGLYSGEIVLGGKSKLRIPLRVQVHNFGLIAASQQIGFYVEAPQPLPRVYAFMKQYGARVAVIGGPEPPLVRKEGHWVIDSRQVILQVKTYLDAGMTPPLPLEIARLSTGLARKLGLYDKLARDPIADAGDMICPRTEKDYPRELRAAYAHAIGELWKDLKRAGVDKAVVLYPVDEPTMNYHRMPMALVQCSIIRQAAPDAKIYTTVHDPARTEELAKRNCIDIVSVVLSLLLQQPDGWSDLAHKYGIKLYSYGGAPGMRTEGFSMVAHGIDRLTLWVCYIGTDRCNADDPLTDMKGGTAASGFFLPGTDGFVSTLDLVAIREAIDDQRYFATAERFIRRKERSTKKTDQEQARKAHNEINRLKNDFMDIQAINAAKCDDGRNKLVRIINGLNYQ